ncbi:MAG TPA: hypothetical protein PKD37_03120 [Oligoflexia bacterium]|nr:hypothetical protein [Oligoflexia bacterium]HMP26959.1 hypothetical protein [Oligoflexia bacterium]
MSETNNNLEDFILSNSIVNYLNASFRGELAFIKILQTLKFQGTEIYPNDQITKESEIEKNIKKTAVWLNEINQGLPIFSKKWFEPETTQSKQALQLLNDLKKRYLKLSTALEDHLLEKKPWTNYEFLKLVAACFGLLQYSRENFAKGLKEFARANNLHELEKQSEDILKENQEKVKISNNIVKEMLSTNQDVQITYFEYFWHKFSKLPFELKTQIQDMNKMLHIYSGNFDYSMADISEQESQQWQNFGIPPEIAGYWRSYNIGPEQAAAWISFGVAHPSTAGLWGIYGVKDEEGLKWLKSGFSPDMAIEWIKLKFDPSEALKFIELGIANPLEAAKKRAERSNP